MGIHHDIEPDIGVEIAGLKRRLAALEARADTQDATTSKNHTQGLADPTPTVSPLEAAEARITYWKAAHEAKGWSISRPSSASRHRDLDAATLRLKQLGIEP